MSGDTELDSSDVLKARFIKSADEGDWWAARQWCNSAGMAPMERDKCLRDDFTPEQQAMWVEFYEIAFMHRIGDWPAVRAKYV